MEKRGSKHLRYALFNATKYVCHWEPEFAAYLVKKKAEGKHYNVVISHATEKLGRVMYYIEMTEEVYDGKIIRKTGRVTRPKEIIAINLFITWICFIREYVTFKNTIMIIYSNDNSALAINDSIYFIKVFGKCSGLR